MLSKRRWSAPMRKCCMACQSCAEDALILHCTVVKTNFPICARSKKYCDSVAMMKASLYRFIPDCHSDSQQLFFAAGSTSAPSPSTLLPSPNLAPLPPAYPTDPYAPRLCMRACSRVLSQLANILPPLASHSSACAPLLTYRSFSPPPSTRTCSQLQLR